MKDQLHLEEFLPYRLSKLSNTVSAGIAATYQDQHELSVTEWRIIAILGRYSDISARQVADKGALDKVAVSRAVNRLLERELVTRRMANDDRRRSVLGLSAAGERLYGEVAPPAIAYETQLLTALSTDEQRQLSAMIDKLSERAERLLSGAG